MYAVIRTGSKQYRVAPGDVITVEKLDAAEGKKYQFDDVVLFHDGKKLVTNPKELARVKVSGKVVTQGRSDKTIVFKFKAKKGYARKKGHRQQLTRVEIEDIIMRKSTPKKAAAKPEEAAAAEEAGG